MEDIIRYDPFKELYNIRKRIGKLFDLFEDEDEIFKLEKRFYPAIDIEETENSFIVKIEIPGINKKDLKIVVDEDGISISGEKKQEKKPNSKNYYKSEISYGKFERYISFPKNVNPETATAKYKDGIIEIEVQKTKNSKSKELEIIEEK